MSGTVMRRQKKNALCAGAEKSIQQVRNLESYRPQNRRHHRKKRPCARAVKGANALEKWGTGSLASEMEAARLETRFFVRLRKGLLPGTGAKQRESSQNRLEEKTRGWRVLILYTSGPGGEISMNCKLSA